MEGLERQEGLESREAGGFRERKEPEGSDARVRIPRMRVMAPSDFRPDFDPNVLAAGGGKVPASPAGRYAPSPSGDLHLGNLRTAVLAWLFARHAGYAFRMRVDDIDAQRSSPEAAARQLEDLASVGIDHDGPVTSQQENLNHYAAALRKLQAAGLVYECYCSRKDIQEATRAPHVRPGIYPGTCRSLSSAERVAARQELRAQGRVPALRLAAGVDSWQVKEAFSAKAMDGVYRDEVDDMVLRRGGNVMPGCAPGEDGDDGAGGHANDYAYNLAVVVDDALTGVRQVVRGDDLLSSAPRQAYVAHLLGLDPVEYVHVPLVLGPEGKRLAKRDGAVTLRDLDSPAEALRWILDSLGDAVGVAPEHSNDEAYSRDGVDSSVDTGQRGYSSNSAQRILTQALETFDPAKLSREPVRWNGITR